MNTTTNTKKTFNSQSEAKLMFRLNGIFNASKGEYGDRLNLAGWSVKDRPMKFDFNGVDLTGATFTGCNFEGADLSQAIGLNAAIFTGCRFNAETKGVTVKQEVSFAPAATAATTVAPAATEATEEGKKNRK